METSVDPPPPPSPSPFPSSLTSFRIFAKPKWGLNTGKNLNLALALHTTHADFRLYIQEAIIVHGNFMHETRLTPSSATI